MASKYAKVVERLKPLPPEDTDYQVKVDTVKRQGLSASLYWLSAVSIDAEASLEVLKEHTTPETHSAESLCKLFGTARETKDRLESVLSEVQLRLTAIEQMLVASHDDDEPGWGLYGAPASTVRLPSGDGARVEKEPMGKIVDREAFRVWCIQSGLERQLALHSGTMNSILKERLLKGDPEPPGVEAYFRPKVKWIRARTETED